MHFMRLSARFNRIEVYFIIFKSVFIINDPIILYVKKRKNQKFRKMYGKNGPRTNPSKLLGAILTQNGNSRVHFGTPGNPKGSENRDF